MEDKTVIGPHWLQDGASCVAIIGTWALAAFFFGFLIFHSLKHTSAGGSWFLEVIQKHFAATIAVPLSAISSACIVLLLGATSGGDLSRISLRTKYNKKQLWPRSD
jgi:hypothetical protein